MSSLQEKICCETKFPPKKNSTEKKDPEISSFTKSPMAQKETQGDLSFTQANTCAPKAPPCC